MAEQAGASALAIHGRTRQQFYSGNADINIIAAVKHAVNIPVIGNGDVFCARDAACMFDRTGCDAVMVARGALGNPFVFEEIRVFLDTGKLLPPPTTQESTYAAPAGAALSIQRGAHRHKTDAQACSMVFQGYARCCKMRESAVRISTFDELVSPSIRPFLQDP